MTPGEAELRAAVAARLVQARIHRGLSQKELAARLGGDSSSLSRCERGVVLPTCLSLLRLAEALGVTADFLLTGRHAAPAARPASATNPSSPPGDPSGPAILQRLEALARLSPEHLGILLPFLDCLVATLAPAGAGDAAGALLAPGGPGGPR